ncbi:hypothetical protein TrVE_jg12682 [Triparma verrucosa]|uniref:Uncharacterized protein n=1 Tax=Triparma verrucosa TaxID=1606542 RepID=A0A9W7F220_9STRA|nr:hypothetical protein TrVE_jg12682 [Triparma verrucosa]
MQSRSKVTDSGQKRVSVTLELGEAESQGELPQADDDGKAYKMAWQLRLGFFLGSLLSPAIGVVGLVNWDTKCAWTCLLFWMFSQVCAHTLAYSNPAKSASKNERKIQKISGFITALPGILGGARLKVDNDTTAQYFGWFSFCFGIFFAFVLPFTFSFMASEYSNMNKKKIYDFVVMSLLKGSGSVLGSLIYISTAAFGCIQRADPTKNLLNQCGNPIIPSFCLSIFLFWTWLVSVLAPPLITSFHVTWSDVALFDLPNNLNTQGSFYFIMSFTSLVMFAMLNEEGESISDFSVGVMSVFFMATTCLLFSVLQAELCGDREIDNRRRTNGRITIADQKEGGGEKMGLDMRDLAVIV